MVGQASTHTSSLWYPVEMGDTRNSGQKAFLKQSDGRMVPSQAVNRFHYVASACYLEFFTICVTTETSKARKARMVSYLCWIRYGTSMDMSVQLVHATKNTTFTARSHKPINNSLLVRCVLFSRACKNLQVH